MWFDRDKTYQPFPINCCSSGCEIMNDYEFGFANNCSIVCQTACSIQAGGINSIYARNDCVFLNDYVCIHADAYLGSGVTTGTNSFMNNTLDVQYPLRVSSSVSRAPDGPTYNYSAWFESTISFSGSTSHSSKKIKKNIIPHEVTSATAMIESVKITEYNLISEGDSGAKRSGTIAEDCLDNEHLKHIVVDLGKAEESLGTPEHPHSRYGVDYQKLNNACIVVVQDLLKRVSDLETKLKSKVK
jgi:hypothetical protein